MRILRKPEDLPRTGPRPRGLVPTMGYLHEGHLELIRRSAAENAETVVSIFVNPLQFGAGEDYESYPRDLERDARLAEAAGADWIFHPDPAAMYPPGFATTVHVGGPLTERWEGERRPGHFDGVATVVTKLFNLVRPDRAYFGEKDYQQLQVVRRFTADLNLGVEIVPVPIVREPDGLARSSRNVYLTPAERPKATVLYRALLAVREAAAAGASPREAERAGARVLAEVPEFVPDYLAVVHPETLEPLQEWVPGARAVVAGRFPTVRLIDNMEVWNP
ncbi:pantoate--beta-alanine ligase [Oceanithermus sp.]|uniref:pantoate--beta-alanine ligase n=2 Tax=Oceanithermus sp. TaxID=2268145 RepID=UPI002579817D|nr:pantoate--beta-alanine ligase [Oceanithermus sp.]